MKENINWTSKQEIRKYEFTLYKLFYLVLSGDSLNWFFYYNAPRFEYSLGCRFWDDKFNFVYSKEWRKYRMFNNPY